MKLMKMASDYAVKHTDRAAFKHSSGYAQAQSGENFGAASTASFEARKALNEQRKYIQQYRDSQIGRGCYRGKIEPVKPELKTSSLGKPGQVAEPAAKPEPRAPIVTNRRRGI